MQDGPIPNLHHHTGLQDFDAAAWTRLPPVRHVTRAKDRWGVLLQEPDLLPTGFRPVEIEVPETTGCVLLVVLAAGGNEGLLSGTGAARPMRTGLRRGDAFLVPPGVASRWHSNTGGERIVHIHLSRTLLAEIAERADLPGAWGGLPLGRLAQGKQLNFLLKHLVRSLRDRPPGWRLAVESVVKITATKLLRRDLS